MIMDISEAKRKKLLDIIRRTIANPGNAEEVAAKIAEDWQPSVSIDKAGDIHIITPGV